MPFRKKPRQTHVKKSRSFFWSIGALGTFACLVIFVWVLYLYTELPTIDNFAARQVSESTKIYDRTGKVLLWEIHGEEKRTTVPFDKISLNIKNATIAIEDSSFYSHFGFNPVSYFRIIFLNALEGKPIGSGGSTITQQLVKNTILTDEHTLSRKIKEVILAVKLERAYSKDEILNLYLNEIPYGSNAYGVEAAAETYFGKSAGDVTLAEAAYLAALPKAPSYYSPYGNHRNDLETRKNVVLGRMKDLKFITNDEYEAAKNEKVKILPKQNHGIRAPHFVMYVQELLNDMYGEDSVQQSGLKVITTLDVDLQAKAEEIISKRAASMQENFNAGNEGLVAIDPKTGRILAMVGSRDYFDIDHEGNFNVTLAHRQPGSTFKPIVYATAFKKGYTPETVLFDLETNFAVAGATPYIPQNYDDKFRGPVTLRQSLAQSLNVPSVKTLYLAGIQDSIETARDLGISSLGDASQYGLTLVLGGGEVSLLDLTSAYGVFANQGIRADKHAILEIRDKNDNIINKETVTQRTVLDSNVANMITNILSDNVARTPAFGSNSPLYFPAGNVAAKTGTTNDYRDVWTVGYSPNIVVGTWAGNNNNTSMTKNVAGFIIAPLWREFMDSAEQQIQEQEQFTKPDIPKLEKPVLRGIWKGSRTYDIDASSGKLATPNTPPDQRQEHILTQVHSILYWVDKDNPTGPIPTSPARDPQFSGWEAPVRAWAAQMGYADDNSTIPVTDTDTTHSPENWPSVTLPENEKDGVFLKDTVITFHPTITTPYSISDIDIFVDDEFVRSESHAVDTISINLELFQLGIGPHTLKLTVYDSIGNRTEKTFPFVIGEL